MNRAKSFEFPGEGGFDGALACRSRTVGIDSRVSQFAFLIEQETCR